MTWAAVKASVKAEHVHEACKHLESKLQRPKAGGLAVTYKDQQLPVKPVLRRAYCLAEKLPFETKVKFSSGEACLQFLRSLGFQAERLPSENPGRSPSR